MLRPAWWFDHFETNTTTSHSEAVTLRLGMELQTGGDGDGPTGNYANLRVDGVAVGSNNTGNGSGTEVPVPPWNKCAFESVGDVTLAPTGCEFRYDMASRFLGMRVQWECRDLDAGSP
jgi:hypothetical protein